MTITTKEKLEAYMNYMLEKKDFVLYQIKDVKAHLQIEKEGGDKFGIRFYTDRLKEKEEELKMINDIIDYFQLEHYKYC